MVTVMNEHIVATAPETTPSGLQVSPPVDPSFPWPLLLSVVKEVEVLVEMSAEHYLGRDHKWTPVATVEGLKYCSLKPSMLLSFKLQAPLLLDFH